MIDTAVSLLAGMVRLAPTTVLATLVFGFFVVLGRSATPVAERTTATSMRVHDLVHFAVGGVRRLHELQRRGALPPLDDLDKAFHLPKPFRRSEQDRRARDD